MPWPRVAAIAAAVIAVLWLSLDGGFGQAPQAPASASAALGVLALVFAVGSWTVRVGGQPERAPLMVGLAVGAGLYAVLRLMLPG